MNSNELREKYLKMLKDVIDVQELENLKTMVLGKKGEIAALMSQMRDLTVEERKEFGKAVNDLKDEIENRFAERMNTLVEASISEQLKNESIDITLPGVKPDNGTLHPLTHVTKEIENLFVSMGYTVVEGEDVELDEYDFERANIPQNHPARDMQDTFYINVNRLLRTHTTAIQTRVLEQEANNLPIKVICPGKTYRRDDDDATHSHQFMQVEGLVVGEKISLGDLKGTLETLARRMFGESREIRFRPSYFQFTEPSVEVDVTCFNCNGKGCNICKRTGWIEILGAGMVHPKVLAMAGIDPKKYSGFAFGLGIERVAMIKYGNDDIRNFYLNDMRFLKQFTRFE